MIPARPVPPPAALTDELPYVLGSSGGALTAPELAARHPAAPGPIATGGGRHLRTPVGSSFKKRYGRRIQDWIGSISTSPLARHVETGTWLRAEHSLGHSHAHVLVAQVLTSRT
ncbi:DUF4287 domain-containing protein [Nonomuraea maritima]|uniref:DUF4287 domain-containing protein n=1 Tax=Nonomuraea maritima TaxID=683260 RepID=UPI00316AE302